MEIDHKRYIPLSNHAHTCPKTIYHTACYIWQDYCHTGRKLYEQWLLQRLNK